MVADRETSRSVGTPQGRANKEWRRSRRGEPRIENRLVPLHAGIGRSAQVRSRSLSTRVSRVRFSCRARDSLPVCLCRRRAQETQKGRGRRAGLINRFSRIRFSREKTRSVDGAKIEVLRKRGKYAFERDTESSSPMLERCLCTISNLLNFDIGSIVRIYSWIEKLINFYEVKYLSRGLEMREKIRTIRFTM